MPQLILSTEGAAETEASVRSDDLAAVCEIAELASRASSLDELFTAALDRFLRLTGMEMGAVLRLDPAGRFELQVQCGLPEAVLLAKAYVSAAIVHAQPLGRGIGPVHHLYRMYQQRRTIIADPEPVN